MFGAKLPDADPVQRHNFASSTAIFTGADLEVRFRISFMEGSDVKLVSSRVRFFKKYPLTRDPDPDSIPASPASKALGEINAS
jgi:hypothetical protein